MTLGSRLWFLSVFAAACATTPSALPRASRASLACAEPRTLIRLRGAELAVHDSDPSGSKPSIFCLHAVGHGGSDFASFEAAFADRYRIITVDWPGQGASPADVRPADAQRYSELFAALVQHMQTRSIAILGNSIGGAVAIRYAATHPENVRALILVDSGGLDVNPGGLLPRWFIGRIARKMEGGARGDADFQRWFADFYRDILITDPARKQREAIVASAYDVAPVLAQAWRSFQREDSDVRALAAQLQVPVLVAWAKHDPVLRWSRSQAAIERIPNVQVHFFEGGHAPFLETPDEFQPVVREFLEGVDGQIRAQPRPR